MKPDQAESDLEAVRQTLRRVALEYRPFDLALVDAAEPARCAIILQKFAVWLLDSSVEILRTDEMRQMHGKIRELYVQRLSGAQVDSAEWSSLKADCLAASRLWPPEWLCAPCFPHAPGLARAAATIAFAISRKRRDQGAPWSLQECREGQAAALRELLSRG